MTRGRPCASQTHAVSLLPSVSGLLDTDLRQALSERLNAHAVRRIAPDAEMRRAAVAFVITDSPDGGPAIILTRRPTRMGRHAGQYALPGGKVDPGETDAEAARRELHEELGVDLDAGAVLGRLDDYATRSGFVIAPFVIWGGPGLVLDPAPDEVEKVLHIPFAELDSEAIPHFQPGVDPDRPILFSRFPTVGHSMYSPTAALVYQFREVCLRGLATRVAHYDQPRFAWK